MDDTSQKIIDATMSLIRDKGYVATTTKDIARLAGVNECTLFRKFQSLGAEVKLDLSWFLQKNQESAAAPRKFALSDFDGLCLEMASEKEVRALLGRIYEEEAGFAEKVKKRIAPGKAPLFEESEMYHPQIFTWQNRYLSGYWACEAYYADILYRLRE